MNTAVAIGMNGISYRVEDIWSEWSQETIEHIRATSGVRADIPEIAIRLALSRGVSPDDLGRYFFPRVSDWMPDPRLIADMESGADVLVQAILSGQKIGLVGDYDVDGATSIAIIGSYFSDLGFTDWVFDVPDRLSEGYGVSPLAVERLHAQGCNVVLVLDSGTTAFPAMDRAGELGMKMVVIDHHLIGETWTPPYPTLVINPKRLDDYSPDMDELCTAGLALMMCVCMGIRLKSEGVNPVPDPMDYMGIVALGTVADMMPLRGLNRAFVAAGLTRFHIMPGLAGLTIAAMTKEDDPETEDFPAVASDDLGFRIGPPVNAAGRISDCTLGARTLLCRDLNEAKGLGRSLVGINTERKALQQSMESLANEMAQKIMERDGPLRRSLVVAHEDWHPGIIGIIAGRLRERYNVPVIVIGSKGKGSGRSAHDFDMGHSLHMAKDMGLLVSGGGHVGAGGLTLAPGMLDAFADFIEMQAQGMTIVPTPVDSELPAEMIGSSLVLGMEAMEPFGIGNKKPTWMIRHAILTDVRWIGKSENTLSITFQPQGVRARHRAVIFSARGTPLEALPSLVGKPVDLIVEISRDTYRSESTALNPLCNIVVRDVISHFRYTGHVGDASQAASAE